MTRRQVNIRKPALSLLLLIGLGGPFAIAQETRAPAHSVAKRHALGLIPDPNPIPTFDPNSPTTCTDKAAKYLRFHIKKGFFGSLKSSTICSLGGGKTGCTWLSKASDIGPDDDGSENSAVLSPGPEDPPNVDWDTSLDIDLGPFTGMGNIIQLKIILDDPNMEFIRAKNAPVTNSEFALRQSLNGKGMFVCRGDVIQLPKNGGYSLIVRAVNKGINWSGLNIGIRYTGGGIVLPMYIDPKVHNDG